MGSVVLALYIYGHICILVCNMLKLLELNFGFVFFGWGDWFFLFCLFIAYISSVDVQLGWVNV